MTDSPECVKRYSQVITGAANWEAAEGSPTWLLTRDDGPPIMGGSLICDGGELRVLLQTGITYASDPKWLERRAEFVATMEAKDMIQVEALPHCVAFVYPESWDSPGHAAVTEFYEREGHHSAAVSTKKSS